MKKEFLDLTSQVIRFLPGMSRTKEDIVRWIDRDAIGVSPQQFDGYDLFDDPEEEIGAYASRTGAAYDTAFAAEDDDDMDFELWYTESKTKTEEKKIDDHEVLSYSDFLKKQNLRCEI